MPLRPGAPKEVAKKEKDKSATHFPVTIAYSSIRLNHNHCRKLVCKCCTRWVVNGAGKDDMDRRIEEALAASKQAAAQKAKVTLRKLACACISARSECHRAMHYTWYKQ